MAKKKYITINEWVTQKLEESGRTKYWLSKQIGCVPSHMNNLLAEADPSSTYLAKMIKAFAIANQTTEVKMAIDWYHSCHGR